MYEDDKDIPEMASKWDVLASFTHLATEIFVAFVHFTVAITEILINKADVVERDKKFHEDVTRTIETITRGE